MDGPDLTIVVPTFNECENVAPLVDRLSSVLDGIAWEAIFVDDDSPDGTAEAVRAIARRNGKIRCVQRIGRRGLSSACIEGILASSSPYVAVMDADLQHDEALLPRMLATLRAEPYDVVVGSRYVAGGSVGAWDPNRRRASAFATRLSRLVTKAEIADPMSGFFMTRRAVFDDAMRRLSAQGFKILLDLLASASTPLRIKELAYEFRPRRHGESKLDALVIWEFAMLLADKLIGHIVPVRFALFAFIGGRGGSGSDSVNAEAQDAADAIFFPGNCNANFGTPPDGSNPRMQMFLCDADSPKRDGDLDAGVIVHEYGHGISLRLTGGPGVGKTKCTKEIVAEAEAANATIALCAPTGRAAYATSAATRTGP